MLSGLSVCGCTKPEAEQSAPASRPDAVAKAAPADSPQNVSGDVGHANPACRACRARQCSNIEGQGLDPMKECFVNADPTFSQQCIEAMNCMAEHRCGLGVMGTIDCYCGATETEACVFGREPATGPCKDVLYKASRQSDFTEFMHKYDNVKFPLGVAHALRVCEARFCKPCVEGEAAAAP